MPTPADVALLAGKSQKRVRSVARQLYATLPDAVSRWDFDVAQVTQILAALGGPDAEAKEWALEVGDVVRRRQVHEAYGGQRQGGISTPRSIPDILIFTDPVAGARYGYDRFEGLTSGGSYSYTGEGQYGRQKFVRGNLALRDAAARGRTIRLFTTKGTLATYVGAFTTDEPVFTPEIFPDVDGEPREGIVFNLVPLEADVSLLPGYGSAAAELYVGEWVPPEHYDIVVPMPAIPDLGERVVSRVEFELQRQFGEWLASGGDAPKRLRLPVGTTVIEPDMFVPSRGWIVEAKKSSGRSYVRTAIGQVLDYANIAQLEGVDVAPVILLPGRPEADLVDLILGLGIVLAVRSGDIFDIVSPGED